MKLFFLITFIIVSSYAQTITFSPLPTDKANKLYSQYNDMLKYLHKETGYNFKFVYSSSYKELIKNFESGKIDIIELGALPYVKLHNDFKEAKPFITFKSKKNKPYYTCDLITTEKNIKTFEDIKKGTQFRLTRKLSTCGYLMTQFIMLKHNQDLKDFNYQYVGTHSNVLLSLLMDNHTVGTAKSTVVEKYKHLGFTLLEKSPPIPGFSFIANSKKIPQKTITKIQNALLKLKPLENSYDKQITNKWSPNTKYGAVKTTSDIYNLIIETLKNVDIPKESK